MSTQQKPGPRIAVIVTPATHYGREIFRGVASYTLEHRPWRIVTDPWSFPDEAAPADAQDFDGIIAIEVSAGMKRVTYRAGTPWVAVAEIYSAPGIRVAPDDLAVGRVAAEHLLSCGLETFAYCGYPGLVFSRTRLEGFSQRLAEAAHRVHGFPPPESPREHWPYKLDQQHLLRWLEGLPKPVGLLACNDVRAANVLGMCHRLGVDVPHDVAVVGVDNDPLACDYADPPLTSVDVNPFRIGYEAAVTLHAMMNGSPPPAATQRVAPLGVNARASSDTFASEDPAVTAAFAYLRKHACEGIRVPDVLQAAPVSRRTLERASQRILGRSPAEEIRRLQLERARRLLASTDMSIHEVADACGFSDGRYLAEVFRKVVGVTPTAFRQQVRTGR